MNAKIKLVFIVICLMVASFVGGLIYRDQTTVVRLETDITELSRRNKSITTRVNDLSAAAERDTETSRLLAEGLAGFSRGLEAQIRRSQGIAERAERIDYLARVLDKGIAELIIKVDLVWKGNSSTTDNSSN